MGEKEEGWMEGKDGRLDRKDGRNGRKERLELKVGRKGWRERINIFSKQEEGARDSSRKMGSDRQKVSEVKEGMEG